MKNSARIGSRWMDLTGALVCVVGAGVVACQNTSGGGGGSASTSTSTGSGGAQLGNFTPQGCSFSIAPRPEYTGWQASAPMVSGSPNIQRVRLGLGGNVKV